MQRNSTTDASIELRWNYPRRVHLVGVGGAGMQSLANVLVGFGWDVSGSDIRGDALRELQGRGVAIHTGHNALVVTDDIEVVIHSDAVGAANVELQRAAEIDAAVYSYAEFLGLMSRESRTVAVAGTHGKSTTTAMMADVFRAAGHDPTIVLGATHLDGQPCGHAGDCSRLLVEACEYQRNFLHLHPDVAVVLGVQWDHVDCFTTLQNVEDAFAQFVQCVRPNGLIVVNEACPTARFAKRQTMVKTVTFGQHGTADWRAANIRSSRGRYHFSIFNGDRLLVDVSPRVAGRHNLMNALATAAVAAESGIPADAIREGLSSFRGLRRRLELVGNHAGVTLIDDYGHHPTEVGVTLAAVGEMYPGQRLWCIFQPHQGDRTAAMLDEFARSLQLADRVCIADVFQARADAGSRRATAADLAACGRAMGANVVGVHKASEIVDLLTDALQPGDVLLTIGAGNIRNVINEWINRVRRYRATG